MIKANTHLHFNGRCEEALNFYAKILGGKIAFSMTWGESPMANKVSKDWAEKILHARLEFEGSEVITADDAPAGNYLKPQGFKIAINCTDITKAEKMFNGLSEKADISMPFAETFWALRFGVLTDQFGVPWMFNCPK